MATCPPLALTPAPCPWTLLQEITLSQWLEDLNVTPGDPANPHALWSCGAPGRFFVRLGLREAAAAVLHPVIPSSTRTNQGAWLRGTATTVQHHLPAPSWPAHNTDTDARPKVGAGDTQGGAEATSCLERCWEPRVSVPDTLRFGPAVLRSLRRLTPPL